MQNRMLLSDKVPEHFPFSIKKEREYEMYYYHLISNNRPQQGMVTHAMKASIHEERQLDLGELEDSLVFTVSSRLALSPHTWYTDHRDF